MSAPTEPTGVLNARFCATLVDEWVRAGVRHAVVAPGSRSTPMALALADRAEIALHVHLDERAAAFVALGLGLASGVPAVVLATSGTAAVELHPAVVEAHQAAVPLLVVTADRPPELHHVGAPQTVDQDRLFGSAVRWFVDPGPPAAEAGPSWRSLGARAVVEALGAGGAAPGPVHLNLPFREPLLGVAGRLPEGRPDGEPWHLPVTGLPSADAIALERAVGHDAARVLVVAGAGCGDAAVLLAAAARLGWPVLADPRSGCRTGDPVVVTTADVWLRLPAVAEELRPDLVLRLGEPPASKVVASWLAACGARQVAVERHGRWLDADRSAAVVLRGDPAEVVTRLASAGVGTADPTWAGRWHDLDRAAVEVLERHLADEAVDLTDPAVARAVARELHQRADAALVVSSSMPVRDLEWYGGSTGSTRVLANRGANGIDGVVSTAVGVALQRRGTGAPTVALVGDLAFLHDTNALIGLAGRCVDLTVVVVDNDGGAIFSFLPPARELAPERFELLFGTPHGTDLPALARAHHLPVTEVAPGDGVGGFTRVLRQAVDGGGVQVVVARTDRAANVAAHDALHRAVHAAAP
ncbi:MAG: 2-succinyl-5-enolpyruvyl-6-hydroxy-3-cyclohexene-1-carboxylic-acid synthase [Acidimicrobiales bacterium]|jgi:2-succinyl-5-enolpyruvyl-6-hydroxy-3-cyclohexene-1-carboxylate synthase|nr:2-succinyl-5-enolpyruvyl-6-hydroxy-3-cyclohexene-1-carboxylic-acid synthase [Acidimicrobiales bacterium]